MSICGSIPIWEDSQEAGGVQLVDPEDLEESESGGYVYGDDADGEGGEWHTFTCPCELCRVERRELMERVLAGQSSQGCEDTLSWS